MIGDKISAANQLHMVVKKHKKNAGTHTAPTLVLKHCLSNLPTAKRRQSGEKWVLLLVSDHYLFHFYNLIIADVNCQS
jgi:hypothetical protein